MGYAVGNDLTRLLLQKICSVKDDRTAGCFFQSRDRMQDCRLAGAVCTYQGYYLAFVYLEAYVLYGMYRAVIYVDVVNLKDFFVICADTFNPL